MRHLVQSFQEHIGERGAHFFDEDTCKFLCWKEVIQFLKTFPAATNPDTFADKLTEALANYNPDSEFLAVHQKGDSVSIELYSRPPDGVKPGKGRYRDGL